MTISKVKEIESKYHQDIGFLRQKYEDLKIHLAEYEKRDKEREELEERVRMDPNMLDDLREIYMALKSKGLLDKLKEEDEGYSTNGGCSYIG